MMCLKLATIIISVYMLVESFLAIAKMPGGIAHFCAKVKYLLAFSSSLVFIYYVILCDEAKVLWLVFGSAGTLAWFVWPRTVYRIRKVLLEWDQMESGDA